MGKYYMEVDGWVVSTTDLVEWATFMENRKPVAKTDVDDLTVSTVFLGLDHGHGPGAPVLWETMIYEGVKDGSVTAVFNKLAMGESGTGGFLDYQWRYSSRQEALRHHEEVVKWVKAGMKGEEPAVRER